MDALPYFACVILLCLMPTIHSQTDSKTEESGKSGLPEVGCTYFGRLERDCPKSNEKQLPITAMPDECKFIIWDKLSIDWSHHVMDGYEKEGEGAYIKEILKAGKKLFISYGYRSVLEWLVVLACNNLDGMNGRDEMDGLAAYLKDIKGLTGLMFRNLEPDEDYRGLCGFTEGLKTYLGVVKETFSDFKIGLQFHANNFVDYYESESKYEWLNFEEIDSVVDVYVINLIFCNMVCTPDLHNSLIPINGNAKYTMEKIKAAIDKSKIPLNKLYFMISVQPGDGDITMNSLCKINNGELCLNTKESSKWCADTTTSYYEKGKLFKEYGAAGMIVDLVDLDDPNCACKCPRSFPGFYALYDGFKCNPQPEPCPLYDRC